MCVVGQDGDAGLPGVRAWLAENDRVELTGDAVVVFRGELFV